MEIQQALESTYPSDKSKAKAAYMLWNLSRVMKKGDVVFAKLGKSEVIGWGVVDGPISYHPDLSEYHNIVPVTWEEEGDEAPGEKQASDSISHRDHW